MLLVGAGARMYIYHYCTLHTLKRARMQSVDTHTNTHTQTGLAKLVKMDTLDLAAKKSAKK